MSITSTMHNALSGLSAQSRAASLVSSNVANAMTEGYAPRSLELSSRTLGGTGSGVFVEGVTRHTDEVLLGDRRLTDAAVGYDSTTSAFLKSLEMALGTPDDPGSLSGRIAKLDAALVEAAAQPGSEARLSAVVDAANNVATHLNNVSDKVQEQRLEADQNIALQVEKLNTGLKQVETLNAKIQQARTQGVDPSGLMDIRQKTIDEMSSILPLKQLPRENGKVALVTTGGAIVLEGKAAQFEFSTVNLIVPEMTQASGALSGLTMNGQPLRTSGDRSPIAGGSLAAEFEVRDELAVDAQQRLDGFARDLMERFEDPAVDATRAVGDPGLFTDNGNALDLATELGLSARISLHAAVDPTQGGAVWRIRDGLGAVAQGEAGNATLINELADAMGRAKAPTSGGFLGAARSSAGLAADMLSIVGADLKEAEAQYSFSSAQNNSLKQMELSKGVDTDAEMQKLMMIEQAYAANARVITAADEMIQALLSI
ncbi:Flagellar hook-associated protein 1 [Aliiroseovarius sp. xm-m-379]|uniref:flagellar hook-associated protein FlgK n=2 Tax=Paracoccaceae TaxID=31989 RepID=UPI00156A2444|nr:MULTISPECIES: flagellar hook-associated protein FlgK [unclassified Aliiroseovarius]NRP24018.1 Flagellar hook-associated protein 1 [Aliiroseovarius sp. xm-m-379]NRP32817.1 Flagellar hook-associated protein 1 [Aliiroseovarius sp. xm-a-104]NRP40376.1 Flagellar hook-associated protein 1 [Aliiroseovarius sp. xm-m-339-2]NRP61382.1 Flagellar hook-associated protein 1 [Aliiroseovarius sp. xm-a-151]NRQ19937.1 Flagellar hook-associated protein 1 [Aliiroseovarius sp. xm-v-204]UWQ08004.1 flagellar hoo